ARTPSQGRHPADRLRAGGRQEIPRQGERGRLAIGSEARAGKRRETAATGGELKPSRAPPRHNAGAGPDRWLLVDLLGDRDDVLVGTGLAGFGEHLALLGQLGEV